jgi:quercetin dioxygenase-like cupin family protein
MQKLVFFLVLFISYGFAAGNVESVTLAKSSQSWDGSAMPAYPKEAPEISVLKITIPAHTELPLHKHPIINAGYMVKGSLKVVTDENKTLHLKAGEALIEVVDKWHYGVNEGDVPVEIVVFYAGTKESSYSVKK